MPSLNEKCACSTPVHSLNQCWLIVNYNPVNKLQYHTFVKDAFKKWFVILSQRLRVTGFNVYGYFSQKWQENSSCVFRLVITAIMCRDCNDIDVAILYVHQKVYPSHDLKKSHIIISFCGSVLCNDFKYRCLVTILFLRTGCSLAQLIQWNLSITTT